MEPAVGYTMTRGRLIVLEGPDGSGKSTQIQKLSAHLTEQDIAHIKTREPGGTPDAEVLRQLVLQGSTHRWQPLTEALLISAARWEHVTHCILPALDEGRWVLCDRFTTSTLAYQGYGHGVDHTLLEQLNTWVYPPHGIADLTFILGLPATHIRARCAQKTQATPCRFESQKIAFYERIVQGYAQIAKAQPENHIWIDATQDSTSVAQVIENELTERIVQWNIC